MYCKLIAPLLLLFVTFLLIYFYRRVIARLVMINTRLESKRWKYYFFIIIIYRCERRGGKYLKIFVILYRFNRRKDYF